MTCHRFSQQGPRLLGYAEIGAARTGVPRQRGAHLRATRRTREIPPPNPDIGVRRTGASRDPEEPETSRDPDRKTGTNRRTKPSCGGCAYGGIPRLGRTREPLGVRNPIRSRMSRPIWASCDPMKPGRRRLQIGDAHSWPLRPTGRNRRVAKRASAARRDHTGTLEVRGAALKKPGPSGLTEVSNTRCAITREPSGPCAGPKGATDRKLAERLIELR